MSENNDIRNVLQTLQNPEQLRELSMPELEQLAVEVRELIVDVVSKNGGHLAPSLGVVELTIALLHCMDITKDKFIWDVGHQSYAWKILTGRADDFATLRKLNGISGFPRLAESKYDHFGVGHSSTSLSAALGMSMARDLAEEDKHIVAIIGDGSLTAGQAFEGLNLAGNSAKKFIAVLNDNEMSISPNVGSLSRFLSRTLSRRWVRQTKKDVLKLLRSIPRIGEDLATYAMRGELSLKSFFTPGMIFEAFRFNYIGPVDGHDLVALKRHLEMAAAIEDGPVLLHVLTRKGKGYEPAEKDPEKFHGVGPFDAENGNFPAPNGNMSFTDVFGKSLVHLAEKDKRIVAITAAMPQGTGMSTFSKLFADRFVDVGICEQHAVTFAAGLAVEGFRPIVGIYSTFLQRAYDQVVHDVCLQNLPVTFCLDRAGLVGEDGATHHGVFDIAYLRHVPNLRIMAPRDEALLCQGLYTSIMGDAPTALRYPRGAGFGIAMPTAYQTLPESVGELLQDGENIVIIAAGPCVHFALAAAKMLKEKQNINVAVFDPIWLKPLPKEQILELVKNYKHILMVEEGSLAGGFSSSVMELLVDENAINGNKIKRLGIADEFIEHGTQKELREKLGLTAEGIATEVENLIK